MIINDIVKYPYNREVLIVAEALVSNETQHYLRADIEEVENCCPFGGDIDNDCEDCIDAGDYHYKDGECVQRVV